MYSFRISGPTSARPPCIVFVFQHLQYLEHNIFAFIAGIAYLRRLIAAEFFCFFIRPFGHFVLGEHVFHLHCFLDCRFAGGDFCQFLVRCAGGEIGSPFLHAVHVFYVLALEFQEFKEMDFQFIRQLTAGLHIINAKAAVHIRVFFVLKQVEA